LGYAGHFDEDVIEQVRRHPDVSRAFEPFLNFPCPITLWELTY
jgi:hypothetical protein